MPNHRASPEEERDSVGASGGRPSHRGRPTDRAPALQGREREGQSSVSDAVFSAYNRSIACPFCHSTETEPMALFGSQLSTAQYYCRACHTPFERIKQESLPGET